MKKTTPFLIAVLCALVAAAPPVRAESLRDLMDRVLTKDELAGARLSVRVIELPHGRVLYSYKSEEALSVASNAKIVTSAAALDLLGPDFELSTTLVACGNVSGGTLYGDLVLVGKGDPSISRHFAGADVMAPLRFFAKECQASGIKRVSGDILANDFYFDRQLLCTSWPSDQWIHWYEAPVCALAFNDNCVDATINPGSSDGTKAIVKIRPDVGYITLSNSIKTTSSLKQHRGYGYGFYRGKTDTSVTARGYYYIKAGPVEATFTVPDPSLYLATGLRAALSDAGIRVDGHCRRMDAKDTSRLDGASVIAVNRVTLADVVKYCNLNSQNLYAEMLFKTLGKEIEGEGSFEAGSRAVGRFLAKAGIQPGEYTVSDGSGLSPQTRFSAMALTEVLKFMYTHRHVTPFRDSLPLSGYEGSLASRLAEGPYLGKIRAKTGYINGASALSGYALTSNGKTLAFSLIFNDFKGSNRYTIKPIQDEICRALVDSAP